MGKSKSSQAKQADGSIAIIEKAAPPANPIEIARRRALWESDRERIQATTGKVGSSVWEAGGALRRAESGGNYAFEADSAGAPLYRTFADVITALTPWGRAYGYQAMALHENFTKPQVESRGVKKCLRLAAMCRLGDDAKAKALAIYEACAGWTAERTEEEIGRALGKAPKMLTPSRGQQSKVDELRGREWTAQLKRGENVAIVRVDARTDLVVGLSMGDDGTLTVKVAINNVAPEDATATDAAAS